MADPVEVVVGVGGCRDERQLPPVRDAPSMKRMAAETSLRMCADQVITGMPSVLKELLENALDAGATRIDIALVEHGAGAISVADNGRGVPPTDHASLALRHATSKLRSFDELESVSSYGFRGEALSSLAALAHLEIVTRTPAEPMAHRLAFAHDGTLASTEVVAREPGTCVTVKELFCTFPVRATELKRRAKAEVRKALALVQAYALAMPHVRLTVAHAGAGGARLGAPVLRTDGGAGELRGAICSLFGASQLGALLPFSATETLGNPPPHSEVAGTDGGGQEAGAEELATPPESAEPTQQPAEASPGAAAEGGQAGSAEGGGLGGGLSFDLESFSCAAAPLRPAPSRPAKPVAAAASVAPALPAATRGLGALPAGSRELRISGFISRPRTDAGRPSSDRQWLTLNQRPVECPRLMRVLTEAFRSATSRTDLHPAVYLNLQGMDLPDAEETLGEAVAALSLLYPDPPCPPAGAPAVLRCEWAAASRAHTLCTALAAQAEGGAFDGKAGAGRMRAALAAVASVAGSQAHVRAAVANACAEQEGMPLGREQAARGVSLNAFAAFACGPSSAAAAGGGGAVAAKGVPKALPRATVISLLARLRLSVREALDTEAEAFTSAEAKAAGEGGGAGASGLGEEDAAMGEEAEAATGEGEEAGEEARGEAGERPSVSAAQLAAEAAMRALGVGLSLEPLASLPRAPPRVRPGRGERRALDDAIAGTQPAEGGEEGGAGGEEDEGMSLFTPSPSLDRPSRKRCLERTAALSVAFSLDALMQAAKPAAAAPEPGGAAAGGGAGAGARIRVDGALEAAAGQADAEVVTALSRQLSKGSFNRMHVIGQFNNGFILTRLRERQPSGALSSDLFIIDQHAASEKANFERLSSKTSLGSQRLLCPLPLELAPAELEAVRANLPAFEAQGFQILLDEEAPAAQRAKLAAVPFCKRASFGVADVHELLALLLDAPAGASIQLPKLRAILASRACHSAVVIGDALQPAKMAAIVRTLSTLEQPWNCPHGRPTIRHVAHLGGAQADY
ncbi:hypothetical protein T492DRAFT_915317 [Pavlovales sp. CCMP2436]|nr:hypothetical protein T492DRAFT_915317 [Pavlovales sp. CCMP2436]